MTLNDDHAPEGDERAKCISNDLSPKQLREVRGCAIAVADAALRRQGKLREFIVQLDALIDATEHFQESLWR